MKPSHPEPVDLLALLRQQVIQAQVRIMELEDERDELTPRLAETSTLLAAAQALAEAKVDEAAHLEKVRADLQAQFDHLRHIQHVTNEALTAARTEATRLSADAEALRQQGRVDRAEIERLLAETRSLRETLDRTEQQRAESNRISAERAARIATLDAELRAVKSSRSWRWTAWLRSIERIFK
jgi:chromosome segregation ATPase